MTDNDKIALLTADAIRTSSDNVTKEIMATISEAETAAQQLRDEGEKLIETITFHTDSFAQKISDFVTQCQATSKEFRSRGERITSTAQKQLRELPVLITDRDLRTGTDN